MLQDLVDLKHEQKWHVLLCVAVGAFIIAAVEVPLFSDPVVLAVVCVYSQMTLTFAALHM